MVTKGRYWKMKNVEKMIRNLPMNWMDYLFLIVRMVDGEFWFYGADHDYNRALKVADAVEGVVVIL